MKLRYFLTISLVLAIFMATAPSTHAQFGFPSIINIIQVNVTGLRCALNATNTTALPFANALVQVRLRQVGIALGLTDSTGSVIITLRPVLFLSLIPNFLTNLVANGDVRVLAPLSICNSTLPSTTFLTSRLQSAGTTAATGFFSTTTLIPTSFG